MTSIRLFYKVCTAFIWGLCLLVSTSAKADLMLHPTRIVLAANERAAQVQLINRGKKVASYRITLVNRRMTETGDIVPVETALPGELFSKDMIRYSPRQVTIQPGETQTVRISVRKPAGLAAGEYRSHLQFDRLPDVEGASNLEQAAEAESGKMSIKLSALVGASIPLIVRHGETSAKVELNNLAIEKTPATAEVKEESLQLKFHANRVGNSSVFGNLVVEYRPPSGSPIEVSKVTGVAVYAPNPFRVIKLPIKTTDGTELKGGLLTLRYDERAEDGGKNIATATLAVP
jgi:P pilus assembly chaperone PapD